MTAAPIPLIRWHWPFVTDSDAMRTLTNDHLRQRLIEELRTILAIPGDRVFETYMSKVG